MDKANIGVIGLGIMGKSLIMNMLDHGIKVCVFNRTEGKIRDLLSHSSLTKTFTIEEFFSKLQEPRIILLMINADAVDKMLHYLLPFLKQEDIVIDGGNSHFLSTEKRNEFLKSKNIYFIGMGISGGEQGARFGPAIMAGGEKKAWDNIKPIFQKIAAKTKENKPCITWTQDVASGHFVKMVHNAIEYAIMELICEIFDFMENSLMLKREKIADVISSWQLNSYLVDITAKILKEKREDGKYVLDEISDSAHHKASGKWAAEISLDLSVPFNMLQEAISLRFLSSLRVLRETTSEKFTCALRDCAENVDFILPKLKNGFSAAFYLSYIQGFMLLHQAMQKYGWKLSMNEISSCWKNGCIIRAKILDDIERAFLRDKNLENLLLDDFFQRELVKLEDDFRELVARMIVLKIPSFCFASSLSFFDGIRRKELPSNLLQAQRDFFGAHMYEKKDGKKGELFHYEWSGL